MPLMWALRSPRWISGICMDIRMLARQGTPDQGPIGEVSSLTLAVVQNPQSLKGELYRGILQGSTRGAMK